MTKVYLVKESYTEYEDRELADEWDRASSSTSWEFGNVTLTGQKFSRNESFETTFDIAVHDDVYVVVAVWSTGDSFGHDSGACSEVFGVYQTYGEAKELEKKLKSGEGYGKYQLPWDGYFESLDYIEILRREVTA